MHLSTHMDAAGSFAITANYNPTGKFILRLVIDSNAEYEEPCERVRIGVLVTISNVIILCFSMPLLEGTIDQYKNHVY